MKRMLFGAYILDDNKGIVNEKKYVNAVNRDLEERGLHCHAKTLDPDRVRGRTFPKI